MEIQKLMDGLWTFKVPLPPHGQFGDLNSFLIEGGRNGKNLLIDTGSYKREYRVAFFDALDSLSLAPSNTDIFITHSHSDHSGNVAELSAIGYKIIMGRIACDKEPDSFKADEKRLILEGMVEIPEGVFHIGEIMACDFSAANIQRIEAGSYLNYGQFQFQSVLTPGHTPGHLCLYDRVTKTMLLGDHVLFDTITGISYCQGVTDTLGNYLDSLKKIGQYQVNQALASHGTVSGNMKKRIEELLDHHKKNLDMVESSIAREPGLTGIQLADRVCQRILSKKLVETSSGQMYYTLGETFAYLDHLLARNRIKRFEHDGVRIYFMINKL